MEAHPGGGRAEAALQGRQGMQAIGMNLDGEAGTSDMHLGFLGPLSSAWVSPTFITILGSRWQAEVINHHIKP